MIRHLALFAAALLPLTAEVKVLRNFTLIDGTGKPGQAGSAMVLTDGRITWVGPVAQLQAPAGAETVDLSDKFVIPGIINLHGHLGNTVGLTQDPKNFTRENLEKNLKTYASYGVTAVMSMGSDQEPVFQLRSEQRAGRPTMTRAYTAGRGFTGKAGYPTSAPGMKGVPYEIEKPEDAAKAVAEQAQKKVDIIKIWVDDHLGKERKIPIDLSKAIIDNAHKHKLPVAAHIFYYEDAKQLVNGGLDALAHSVRDKLVDKELVTLMKSKGAWQAAATLTRELSVFAYAESPKFLDDPLFRRSVSDDVISTLKGDAYRKRIKSDPDYSKYAGFLENAQKNLKSLVEAGVKVGFGTDTGPPARFPGYFEHLEMELMAEAGLTPGQIITIATKNSAEFLKAADLGTLAKGKWADLLVLSKDPLADIRNTRSVEGVYIAGNKVN